MKTVIIWDKDMHALLFEEVTVDIFEAMFREFKYLKVDKDGVVHLQITKEVNGVYGVPKTGD